MDSQAEYLESDGNCGLFRNSVTGEKAAFITYPVRIDRRGRYHMNDKALVISRDDNGREEQWWIQYIPVTHPGLAYSVRIWQEPDGVSPKRGARATAAVLLVAAAFQVFQLWLLWLWLRS